MPTWNGDPRDFEAEYRSVFDQVIEMKQPPTVKEDWSIEKRPTSLTPVGCDEIKMPEVSAADMNFDASLRVVRAEQEMARQQQEAEQKRRDDEQIDREWEAAGTIVWSFSQALEAAQSDTLTLTAGEGITTDTVTITVDGEAVEALGDDWYFIGYNQPAEVNNGVYSVTTTASTWPSDYDEDDADANDDPFEEEYEHDYITVSEFKNFIYDLIEEKGGALPDVQDWKRIKNMMDQMRDDEEEDEEWYYGCNEESVLLGEADDATSLYYEGEYKVQTTPNGIQISYPDIGDMFTDSDSGATLRWNGTNWDKVWDESYRG